MITARPEAPPRLRDFLPALALLLASVLGILALVAQPTPGQKQLAILLPPWDGPMQAAIIAARAGGMLVDSGGWPFVFIATSERPDFAASLYRAGAWAVMNPITAHGCLSGAPQPGA